MCPAKRIGLGGPQQRPGKAVEASVRLALAAFIAAVYACGAPAALAKPHACAFAGSKTLKSTKQVRVYRVKHRLYGCLKSNGHRQHLTTTYDDGYVTSGTVDQLRVAGHY